jgi:hypothetical protein
MSSSHHPRGWDMVLARLGLGQYHSIMTSAAIDTPQVLGAMRHEDAMSILKELEILPGHRHRLLSACLNQG